jgi:hypothetical protein
MIRTSRPSAATRSLLAAQLARWCFTSESTTSESCTENEGLIVLGRVVRGQYDVQLSAKVVELSSAGILYARGNTQDDNYAAGIVRRALRNPDVVDAAASVKWLMESGEQRRSTVLEQCVSDKRV